MNALAHNSNYDDPMSCGLLLHFNDKDHPVDSIVEFKRTFLGSSRFKLAMYCPCCHGRSFWFSRKEISKNGNQALDDLAQQVEEMQMNGVDISSQMTYYAEDQDDSFDNMDSPQSNHGGQNQNQNIQVASCFDFSFDDEEEIMASTNPQNQDNFTTSPFRGFRPLQHQSSFNELPTQHVNQHPSHSQIPKKVQKEISSQIHSLTSRKPKLCNNNQASKKRKIFEIYSQDPNSQSAYDVFKPVVKKRKFNGQVESPSPNNHNSNNNNFKPFQVIQGHTSQPSVVQFNNVNQSQQIVNPFFGRPI